MSEHPPVPPGALPGGAPPATYPTGPPLGPPPPPVPPGALRPGGAWPGPPAPGPASPTPPGGGRRGWVVVAAVVAAVALVAATFAAFRDGDDTPGREQAGERAPRDRDEPPPAPTSPPTTTAPDAPPPTLEQLVDEIQAFVEAERGLLFLEDVTVELADDAEFEARLLEDFDEDAAELADQGRLFEALGLIPPGTDLVEAVRSLLGAGVVGFYDPVTDELVVRGTSTSPYVRTVIAHELVHALDDQHFELDRPELDEATGEEDFGFTGLVEGDAVRIEDAYRATFTPEEEEQATAEELSIGLDFDFFSVPPVLFDLLLAPYVLGPVLVERVLDEGGQGALDLAFVDPPTTSEHLLDPQTFLAGEGAVDVPVPATDDGVEPFDEGVLGALGIAVVLGLSPALVPTATLDPAVEGWGGDRYVAWDAGGRTCVRANIVGDSEADTAELVEALDEWAASAPFGVEATLDVPASGPFTLTTCTP